jgi:hypothetical protein
MAKCQPDLDLKIQILTAKGYESEIDLLTDDVLKPFGKTKTDVQSVGWTDHFNDSVYTELGLAGTGHPLIGSGSATLSFCDGKVGELSDIFYQDFDEAKDHYGGKIHWNHERRYMMTGWSGPHYEKHPKGTHVIDSAPWIQVCASGSDGTRFVKRMPWIPKP